jgi:hypothetical protein
MQELTQKITKPKRSGVMAQEVEHLPSKHRGPEFTPSNEERKNKKENLLKPL